MIDLSLSEKWKELEEYISKNKIDSNIPKVKIDSFVKIGMDSEQNKVIIAEYNSEQHVDIDLLPNWQGTDIYIENTSESKNVLNIKLLDDEYVDIFNAMLRDILLGLKFRDSSEDKFTIYLSNITKWYNFFKKNGKKIMSENRQRGLFGELFFIKSHLVDKISYPKAIKSWAGYSNATHDFSFPGTNIEVKTTIRKAHKKIKISSEKQLDNTGIKNLNLYCVTLNIDFNNGLSLVDIVNQIKSDLVDFPNSLNLFNDHLNMCGYNPEHELHYCKNKYIKKRDYMFSVNENLPRIIDIPEGTGDLEYTLSIAACMDNEIEIESSIASLLDIDYSVSDEDNKGSRDQSLEEQILNGESENVEFKSTLRINLHTNKKDPKIENACLKTLVGFMNKNGGTLFIGIDDNSTILNLEQLESCDMDKLQRSLTDLIKHRIGPDFLCYIDIHPNKNHKESYITVKCKKSDTPVFLKISKEDHKFFVRSGSSTEQLNASDTQDYIKRRFK